MTTLRSASGAGDPPGYAELHMPVWVFWAFMTMALAIGVLTALTVQEWL